MYVIRPCKRGTFARRQFMRGTDPTKSKWVCPTNNLHLIRFALHAYVKYDRVVVRCKLILLFF